MEARNVLLKRKPSLATSPQSRETVSDTSLSTCGDIFDTSNLFDSFAVIIEHMLKIVHVETSVMNLEK